MAFEKRKMSAPVPGSPEALYPRLPRSPQAPKELWARQADVLRAYHRDHLSTTDVALELPTGAGKTLVGCLIAEWRRQMHGERVAYLAPTRQLARQAAAHAAIYGIPVSVLVGRHTQWAPGDAINFTQAKSVAFATYSAVFNTNPRINAQMLVLDDAHAAEGYVASNWSVKIDREESAYLALLDVLEQVGAVSQTLARRLRRAEQESAGTAPVYLAGVAETAAAAADVEKVLDEAITARQLSDEAMFAATMLRGGLPACLIYLNRRQILIRPLIAPTSYHPAFAAAGQRVYMSATLGDGGELERAFGRRTIARIPVSSDWENQGTGRRFFCFPDLLPELSDATVRGQLVGNTITAFGKTVLIAPNNRIREQIVDEVAPQTIPVWRAEEFSDAPEDFTQAPSGLLALANRYDGIDLPDEFCRLVVLAGLPAGAHLQERFIHESLGALIVLTERIRTRLTQGAGRATRNSADYAAVLILGRDLAEFCGRMEVRAAMHPELRAEISFGLEYSTDISATEFRENLEHFRTQDGTWQQAESDIRAYRDAGPRTSLPGTDQLAAAVRYEVAAVDAAWQGDWSRAIEEAKRALERLAGGQEIRRYQALWHYLLASWALIAARRDDRDHWLAVATTHFRDARAAARGTQWLAELTTDPTMLISSAPSTMSALDRVAVSTIAASPLRTCPAKTFTDLVTTIRTGLTQTSAPAYEQALGALGRLAGADVLDRSGADAEPDAVWCFKSEGWLAWEAKSAALPTGEISARRVQQAGGHLNYVASVRDEPIPPGSTTMFLSPQEAVHPAAARVADEDVYLVSPTQVNDLAERMIEAWEAIRTQMRGTCPAEAEPIIGELLRARQLLPSQWWSKFTARRLRNG